MTVGCQMSGFPMEEMRPEASTQYLEKACIEMMEEEVSGDQF